ncbi:glycosyltransferase [Fulvivirgaceae bacterium BMA12]|uniref:Glycosyltransferase n=1 Tax=Agaribacillus aureus TaxID=3051825 RepID=A0ABT8LC86_9BACT|nr:glycosyltransferase [Fulvivirgaceae bacterium BMA12]
MKKFPSVSLIINNIRPQALELALLSVIEQKCLPNEIIIADPNSPENTKIIISDYQERFSIPLKHVYKTNPDPTQTAILNESIRNASFEYIIQISSDIILHPHYILDHLESARPMSFAAGCGIRINKKLSQHLLTNKPPRLLNFSAVSKERLKALHLKYMSKLLCKPGLNVLNARGQITAFWKQDFVKVNGYNEEINDPAKKDAELAVRFLNNGIRNRTLKFAAIQHQLYPEKTGLENPPVSDPTIEETINKKVKYCQKGLIDLGDKQAEAEFRQLQQGKISATIITFNEEKNIETCLKSLEGIADEIIVVDSHSKDETENICKQYRTTFIKRPFEGHIQQKQFALSQAKHQYILSLDADEYLTQELRNSIQGIKNNLAYHAYSMNRRNYYRGKNINHAGWYPDKRVRLFNKDKARWGGENPHDVIVLDNPTYTLHLQGDLHHNTLDTLEEHKRQTDNYAKIAARYKFEHGRHKKTALLKMLFSPLSKFLRMYVLKLGFLDGGFGLRICYEEFRCTHKKYRLLLDMYKNQEK